MLSPIPLALWQWLLRTDALGDAQVLLSEAYSFISIGIIYGGGSVVQIFDLDLAIWVQPLARVVFWRKADELMLRAALSSQKELLQYSQTRKYIQLTFFFNWIDLAPWVRSLDKSWVTTVPSWMLWGCLIVDCKLPRSSHIRLRMVTKIWNLTIPFKLQVLWILFNLMHALGL